MNGHGDQGYQTREEGERYFSETTVCNISSFPFRHAKSTWWWLGKNVVCLPYRVVPPRLILTVVGKQIHDELIDL